jgi:hypothetical protein
MGEVDEYVARLPDGLASYPEATVKGSVVLAHCVHPAFRDVQRDTTVPAEARHLLEEPPTRTTWVAEAHFNALMAALYDRTFRTTGGYEAYEAWVTAQSRKLFETNLYRILFVFVSPERLLAATANRWAAFHRGTTLDLVKKGDKRFEVELKAPAHLYSPMAFHGFSGAFRAAVLAAGGIIASIEWTPRSPSAVRWSLQLG